MTARRKITPEQEMELVALYQKQGPDVAGKRAVELGVNPQYPQTLARLRGLKRPRWRAGAPFKPEPVRKSQRTKDPRWERAKAIGAVSA